MGKLNRFLLAVVLTFTSGCGRAPRPVAEAASSPNLIPVGQIPAGMQSVHFRTNPLGNDSVALQDGRRLFNWYNCSGCHGGHAGGGMGPSLRDQVWLYGNRDDQIFDSIAQGRSAGMPAWGSKISDVQVWELVAYIKSMGTPQEPDPPVEPANEMVTNPDGNTATGINMQTSRSEVKDNK